MHDRRLLCVLLLSLVIGVTGCDTTATQPSSQVVVEAYLRAAGRLPTLRLSRTVGVNENYDPAQNAVQGADVAIDRLGPDSTVVNTVPYVENDSVYGLYTPVARPLVVPQSTYRLRVETEDGTTIRATTTVPGPLSLIKTENDTSVYQSPDQPALTIETPSETRRTAGQNVFTFTTTSLLDFETTPDAVLRRELTPFYADSYSPSDDSLETFRVTSSGLLNEGNFERSNGTITIDLPWLAVAFYGPNRAAVNVVDDNYYDFLRSQQVQQGGFAPGEIPNVIDNIDGGTGIFGSYARASQTIFICRKSGCP